MRDIAALSAGFVLAVILMFLARAYRMRRGSQRQAAAVVDNRANNFRIFALSRIRPDLVMLGDSLTNSAPWHELLDGLRVANRGLGGMTTGEILDYLDDVIAQKPRTAFLLAGINDITIKVPPETIGANIEQILTRLRQAGISTLVSPVFPVTSPLPGFPHITNDVIAAANRAIVAAAARTGAKLVHIPLSDDDGALRKEFSQDGLHLTAAGYAVWRDALLQHVSHVKAA
jgi:lysophospholipase L1-like esterase